jgi:hypothetical protein
MLQRSQWSNVERDRSAVNDKGHIGFSGNTLLKSEVQPLTQHSVYGSGASNKGGTRY